MERAQPSDNLLDVAAHGVQRRRRIVVHLLAMGPVVDEVGENVELRARAGRVGRAQHIRTVDPPGDSALHRKWRIASGSSRRSVVGIVIAARVLPGPCKRWM